MKVTGAAQQRLPQVEDLGQRPSAKPLPQNIKGHGPAFEISFSETANEVLNLSEAPGKSHHSTAHRARQALADNEALAALPFGKMVSAIAHGIDPATLIQAPVADDGEATGEGAADATTGDSESGDDATGETQTGDGGTGDTGTGETGTGDTGTGADDGGLELASDALIDAVADGSSAEAGLVDLLEEIQEAEA